MDWRFVCEGWVFFLFFLSLLCMHKYQLTLPIQATLKGSYRRWSGGHALITKSKCQWSIENMRTNPPCFFSIIRIRRMNSSSHWFNSGVLSWPVPNRRLCTVLDTDSVRYLRIWIWSLGLPSCLVVFVLYTLIFLVIITGILLSESLSSILHRLAKEDDIISPKEKSCWKKNRSCLYWLLKFPNTAEEANRKQIKTTNRRSIW